MNSRAEKKQWAQDSLIFDVTEDLLIAMEDAGITQKELAKKIGKSKSHISQLLNGERNMTLRTLASLCFEIDANIEVNISHRKAHKNDLPKSRDTYDETSSEMVFSPPPVLSHCRVLKFPDGNNIYESEVA